VVGSNLVFYCCLLVCFFLFSFFLFSFFLFFFPVLFFPVLFVYSLRSLFSPTTGMLKEVYGKAFKTYKVANQLLEKLIVTAHLDAGGALSVEKFNFFCTKHPGLLFPAFRFQIELQEKLGGKPFWVRAAKTRVKLSNGANLTVQQLLMAHVSETAFNEVTRHDSRSAVEGRKHKTGVAKMVEKMQSAHQNDEGRVRRGTVLDALGVRSDPIHVVDAQHMMTGNLGRNGGGSGGSGGGGSGSAVDPKLQVMQFRDFAMNTGTVADRRARRQIEGGAKAKLKALSAFTKGGAFGRTGKKKGGVGSGGWRSAKGASNAAKGGGKGKGKGGGGRGVSKKKSAGKGLGGKALRSASLKLKRGGSEGGVGNALKASAVAARKKRMLLQSSVTPV
jgi:hypothetical protein